MNLPEFSQTMRRVGMAFALAGMLTVLPACGGGETTDTGTEAGASPPAVTGEVEVTEEVAVVEEGTPSVTEATPAKKPPVLHTATSVRDPFVNPVAGGVTAGPSTPAPPTPEVGEDVPGEGPVIDDGTEDEPQVAAPEIRVTGIVRSGGSYRAILTGPENSYIVGVNDKLGAYRITSITAKTVTVSFQGHSFTLKMEEEFGPGGSRAGSED